MHPSTGTPPKIATLALLLLLVTLWLLMRGYHGLIGDAQIYAFQALARLHPPLATDLYLQNTSQDQFTVFSPLYAACISLLGLENAARLLSVLLTAWLLGAAWNLARAVGGRDAAWLAVAFLLIVAGDYGGSGVFRISEQFLTARLPAEALIVTALVCHVHGRKRLGYLLAAGALIVHPLIALPGLLLMICMSLSPRLIVLAALGGFIVTLGIAVLAIALPAGIHGLTVMDAAWTEVVRERSQFLFLPLWSVRDWEVNTQPFICLGFTAIALPDRRIRMLCAAAALVGVAGLVVAWIGSVIGPVAVLVQGQAWRWVWVSVFVSALLLPGVALRVWREDACGPLCVVLLVSGWTLPTYAGMPCISLALVVWALRLQFNGLEAYFRWAAAIVGVAIVAWISMKSWAIAAPALGRALFGAGQIRDIFGLRVPALLFGTLVWWSVRVSRTALVSMLTAALLAALSIFLWPAAFRQSQMFASSGDVVEFADWRDAIPPTSTVLVTPPRDAGAFVWFTLGRPNYLAIDQSAGVVFSRVTSMEVRRRSEVLLPLMDPNWKVLTGLRAATSGHKADAAPRALSTIGLRQVCADPELGFVISPKDVGFHPVRHERAGTWKGWNLYDCREVRSTSSAT
ncbi:MAG: hypothetical protein WA803_16410 [Steroidobacteraceae bacterium]